MCFSCGGTCGSDRDGYPVNMMPVRSRYLEFQQYQPPPQMVYPSRRMPGRGDLNTFPRTRLDPLFDPRAWPAHGAEPSHRVSTNHHSSSSHHARRSHRSESGVHDRSSRHGEPSFRDGISRGGGSSLHESSSRRDGSRHHPPRHNSRPADAWAGNAGVRYPPRSRQGGIKMEPGSGSDNPRSAGSRRGPEPGYDMPMPMPKAAHITRSSRHRGSDF